MKITNLVSTPLSWAWSQLKTSWYGRSVVIVLGGGAALVYYFLRQRRGAPSPSQKPAAPQQPPAPPSKPAAPQPKGPSAPPPAKPAPVPPHPLSFPWKIYVKSDDAFVREHVQPVAIKIQEITDKLPEWHEGLPKGTQMELGYLRKLKGFIENFQKGIPLIVKMMQEDLWFDGYSTDVWNTFLSEAKLCIDDMKPTKNVDSKVLFEKMKALIAQVRTEKDNLSKFVSDRIKGLCETGKVPHYVLTDRQLYVSYVRLNPDELELGGRSMEDVGLNHFPFFEAAVSDNFLPSIENLRILSIYLRFELERREGRELTPSLCKKYRKELQELSAKVCKVHLTFEKESLQGPLSKVGQSLVEFSSAAISSNQITLENLDQLRQYLNELELLDPEKQLLQIKKLAKDIATSINQKK